MAAGNPTRHRQSCRPNVPFHSHCRNQVHPCCNDHLIPVPRLNVEPHASLCLHFVQACESFQVFTRLVFVRSQCRRDESSDYCQGPILLLSSCVTRTITRPRLLGDILVLDCQVLRSRNARVWLHFTLLATIPKARAQDTVLAIVAQGCFRYARLPMLLG